MRVSSHTRSSPAAIRYNSSSFPRYNIAPSSTNVDVTRRISQIDFCKSHLPPNPAWLFCRPRGSKPDDQHDSQGRREFSSLCSSFLLDRWRRTRRLAWERPTPRTSSALIRFRSHARPAPPPIVCMEKSARHNASTKALARYPGAVASSPGASCWNWGPRACGGVEGHESRSPRNGSGWRRTLARRGQAERDSATYRGAGGGRSRCLRLSGISEMTTSRSTALSTPSTGAPPARSWPCYDYSRSLGHNRPCNELQGCSEQQWA